MVTSNFNVRGVYAEGRADEKFPAVCSAECITSKCRTADSTSPGRFASYFGISFSAMMASHIADYSHQPLSSPLELLENNIENV